MSNSLLTFPTLVEAPFVNVKIGDYTFGQVERNGTKSIFPNFIDKLTVTKINGQLNLYELSMSYQITAGDDPNMLEKVFSSVQKTRDITFTYGDWAYPQNIYKEEKALITNVTSDVSFASSKISYNVSAVSTALALDSAKYNFNGYIGKGSTLLLDMINTKKYNITNIFKGMTNQAAILQNNLLPNDDTVVDIQAGLNMNVLDRINQIVNSMKCSSDPNAIYGLTINDDVLNTMNGAYFKVNKVSSNTSLSTEENAYSIDIGYPGDNFVTDFSLQNNQQWSILYNSSANAGLSNYYQKIDGFGKLVNTYSNSITRGNTLITTDDDANWWKQVTTYPIQATIKFKGLVRPSMLMQYIKINCYFYGRKHISSGLYNITKQVDEISASGYSTTLNLLRTKGDDFTYVSDEVANSFRVTTNFAKDRI